MAAENHGAVLRGIGRIFDGGSLTGLDEGQLVRHFASGDEAAFEALIARHGPLVLGVCRRSLGDPRDVEDAFQATFLVLLRKAGGLRDPEAIGPWLYGVAYRVSARIRARAVRRPERERRGARSPVVQPDTDLEQGELRRMLDEEIGRLPEKYRRPVVLCYLEGRTHEEAARRLRCTTGSVRGRLDRARRKLQERLVRRGVAPAVGLAALASSEAAGAVSAALAAATVTTLKRAATARAAASSVPAALELADGVFRAMVAAKLKMAASFLVAASILVATGVAWLVATGGSVARDGRVGEGPARVALRGGAPAQKGEAAAPKANGPSMEIRVVDQRTGKPLPGVSLALDVDRKPGARATTGDAGRASIAIPEPMPQRLSLVARKEGFATTTLWFLSSVLGRDVVGQEFPAAYTLKLYPAETIGGVVQDEQGRPIAGARVETTAYDLPTGVPTLSESATLPPPATTDEQGRWRCSGMPAGIEVKRVEITVTHPDFERVVLGNGEALPHVRAGKPTVMPRGVDLAGRVVDPAGRPIVGARVILGEQDHGQRTPRTATDADGRFRLAHVPAGESVVTVQADGYAPDLRKLVARSGVAPIELRLVKGRTIRGRVVDGRGQPVAAASVGAEGWRGYLTLDWQATTDGEGEFEWTDAPPDSFWIRASREGYLQAERLEVPPNAGELRIALNRELRVRGTVVDAGTRHAIPAFTVVPGIERGSDAPTYWTRDLSRPGTRGTYRLRVFDQTRPEGRRLRIEAEGYMPAVSRVIRDDEDEPVINFVLKKATDIAGVVRLPDGAPLAGADVVMVVPSHPAFLTNGQPPGGDDHRAIKTGGDGRFRFPPQEPPYAIVVLHDRGFAERAVKGVEASSSAVELTITPWGRIEGTFRIGRAVGAGQTLHLDYGRQGDTPATVPWWSGETKTDDAGHFTFERVVPGRVIVSRQFVLKEMTNRHTISYTNTRAVEVAPGATTRVELGGTGRPLVGKFTPPAGSGPIDWTFGRGSLIPRAVPAPKPAGPAAGKGPKGPPLEGGGYSLKLEADGSFREAEVEAGTYDLIVVVSEPPRDPRGIVAPGPVAAFLRREVVVPEMPGGRSDEPLDLGAIATEAPKKP